jgi:hypothetical protein
MKMIRLVFPFFRVMEHQWNEIDRGNPKYSGKNLSQCHFVTTNPTWTCERPATNGLSHCTAHYEFNFHELTSYGFLVIFASGRDG